MVAFFFADVRYAVSLSQLRLQLTDELRHIGYLLLLSFLLFLS